MLSAAFASSSDSVLSTPPMVMVSLVSRSVGSAAKAGALSESAAATPSTDGE